jgi:integrase
MSAVAFRRLVDELESLYRPPRRSKATWCKLRQVLAEVGAMPGVRTTRHLTAVTIAAWIDAHPGRAPATVHALLRSLRAACSYAVAAGYLAGDRDPFRWRGPAAWIDPGDAGPSSRDDGDDAGPWARHRTADEVARLLRQADREARRGPWEARRLRALCYVLAYTGMRKGEALGLRAADIDLAAGVLRLRSNSRRRLKTRGAAAPLAIPPDLAAVLADWIPRSGCEWLFPGVTRSGPWLGGPPGDKALDQVKALGARAGVPGLTILAFRHTFATLAERWQLGELELQRQLRHTRRRTQDAYRGADLDTLRCIARKVRFAAPSPATAPAPLP